jgi:chromosomal replication initiation ATPase DnaA
MFSESKIRARKDYRVFMADEVHTKKEDVYTTIDQRIQGDEEFVDRIRERYDGDIKKERKKKAYSLLGIAMAVERRFGVTLEQLRSPSKGRQIMIGRRVFSLAAREYGYKGIEIATFLEKEPSSVTKYGRDENIRPELERLIKGMQRKGTNGNFQV